MGFFSSAKDSPRVGGVLSKWAGEIEVDKQKKAVKAYGNDMMNFIGSLSQEQQMNPDVLKQGEAKISAKYDLPPQARKLFIDMMYESGTRQQGAEDREYQKQLRGQAQEDRSKKIFRENIGIADQALMQEADSPQPFGQEGVFATPARDKGSAIEQMSYAGKQQYEKDRLDREKKEADIALTKARTSGLGAEKAKKTSDLKYEEDQAVKSIGAYINNIGGSFDPESRTIQINLDESGAKRDEVLKYVDSLGFEMFGKQTEQDRKYWLTGDDKILNISLGAFKTGKPIGVSTGEKASSFDELMKGIKQDDDIAETKKPLEKQPIKVSKRAGFATEKPLKIDKTDTETYAKKILREGVKGVTKTGEWNGMPIGKKRGKVMIYKNGKWGYMKRAELKKYKESLK